MRLHQVYAGHRLGHGVFNLKPRIGLDEDERLRTWSARNIDQEFKCPEIAVTHAFRKTHRRVDDLPAEVIVKRGRRGDLENLLKAALDTAFPLAQVGDVTRAVAQDLDFDMTGEAEEFLHVNIGETERRFGLRLAALVRGIQVVDRGDHPRAPAAPARQRLDDHRPPWAKRGEERPRLLQRHGMIETADHRNGCLHCRDAGARLVTEQFQMRDVRTDKGQTGLCALAGEVAALREEAIAGVDGIASRVFGHRDHRPGV